MILACQWCKDLMGWGLAQGFAWTIGLLLAVPFLLVAVITWRVSRALRLASLAQDSPERKSRDAAQVKTNKKST